MDAKRFEVLDSLRDEDDEQMIEHATRLVDAIKDMYRINYSKSKKQIQDYELVFIDVPKQNNGWVYIYPPSTLTRAESDAYG